MTLVKLVESCTAAGANWPREPGICNSYIHSFCHGVPELTPGQQSCHGVSLVHTRRVNVTVLTLMTSKKIETDQRNRPDRLWYISNLAASSKKLSRDVWQALPLPQFASIHHSVSDHQSSRTCGGGAPLKLVPGKYFVSTERKDKKDYVLWGTISV